MERILRAVECVPDGSVLTYGDVGELAGCGPRHVGRVMALHGSGVTWWRVTDASGRLPDHLMDEARARWRAEGVPLAADGRGCAIRRCRADLTQVGAVHTARTADLPPA